MAETTKQKTAWDEKRTVRLDRAKGDNAVQTMFVSVNGRDFHVPRGKNVEVPLPVYNTIMRSQNAQDSYDEKCEELAKSARAKELK